MEALETSHAKDAAFVKEQAKVLDSRLADELFKFDAGIAKLEVYQKSYEGLTEQVEATQKAMKQYADNTMVKV